jgi:cellulose binding protein with CBM2 domain
VGLAVVPDPARLLHAGHHGLVGMAERARVCGGSLRVDLSPLGGTRIAATVPRDAAPRSTGPSMSWRIAVIAAAADGCGALIVILTTSGPPLAPARPPCCHATSSTPSSRSGSPASSPTSRSPNTGALAIDGWEMTFAYTAGQKMTNGWNAIVTQEGDTIRAEAAGGNTRIDPNASLTFGLQGTWSGRNPMPSAFVLNGVRCSTPY